MDEPAAEPTAEAAEGEDDLDLAAIGLELSDGVGDTTMEGAAAEGVDDLDLEAMAAELADGDEDSTDDGDDAVEADLQWGKGQLIDSKSCLS